MVEQLNNKYDNRGRLQRTIIMPEEYRTVTRVRIILSHIENEMMEENPDQEYIKGRVNTIIEELTKGFKL